MKRSPAALLSLLLALPALGACSHSADNRSSPSVGAGAGPGGPGDAAGSASTNGGSGSGASGGAATGTSYAGAAENGGAVGFGGPPTSESALRKVKNVLTGLAPSDAELATGKMPGGLKTLIGTWMGTPEFQNKLILFFQNTFQQSQLAVLDFEFQLRKRPGAFDLSYDIFGDNAYPTLFQNMKESFARTAIAFVSAGRPMSDLLTTDEFMMTTALKSLYMQIEAPYDIHTMNFKFNHGTRPALSETLDPNSPNYMTFGFEAPTTTTGRKFTGTCAGDSTKISTCPGNTLLFQVLLGSMPRDTSNNSICTSLAGCMEHAIKPYFTADDLSDWQMVKIVNGTPLMPFDLPALRASGATLSSKIPRVGFFSTPAFFAVWNTNDSNQHRVTANQAMLGSIGLAYTNADSAIVLPPTTTAIDGEHAVDGSACYGCHKSLDPMRQFWGNSFDYNDKQFTGKSAGPASFGYGNVSGNGKSLADFGSFLQQVTDEQVTGNVISRFALEMTQKLCFFANSTKCDETDPEMRRIASAFETSSFKFDVLVSELFSSALVTNAEPTKTNQEYGATVSIMRRDQFCQALSNRLAVPDICEINLPTPTGVTSAMNRLAGALPADSFSRGVAAPVTPSDPSLFFRAASELLCEAVAAKVVDSGAGAKFTSTDVATAVEELVTTVMGVPPTDPQHQAAVAVLTSHFNDAKTGGATATNALRSTFSAACQSAPSLALGI
ncbi:MAG: hypothetical protein WDO69_27210 [Pseudomonadota bacterium]